MTGNKHYPKPVCCIETLWSSLMMASLGKSDTCTVHRMRTYTLGLLPSITSD